METRAALDEHRSYSNAASAQCTPFVLHRRYTETPHAARTEAKKKTASAGGILEKLLCEGNASGINTGHHLGPQAASMEVEANTVA